MIDREKYFQDIASGVQEVKLRTRLLRELSDHLEDFEYEQNLNGIKTIPLPQTILGEAKVISFLTNMSTKKVFLPFLGAAALFGGLLVNLGFILLSSCFTLGLGLDGDFRHNNFIFVAYFCLALLIGFSLRWYFFEVARFLLSFDLRAKERKILLFLFLLPAIFFPFMVGLSSLQSFLLMLFPDGGGSFFGLVDLLRLLTAFFPAVFILFFVFRKLFKISSLDDKDFAKAMNELHRLFLLPKNYFYSLFAFLPPLIFSLYLFVSGFVFAVLKGQPIENYSWDAFIFPRLFIDFAANIVFALLGRGLVYLFNLPAFWIFYLVPFGLLLIFVIAPIIFSFRKQKKIVWRHLVFLFLLSGYFLPLITIPFFRHWSATWHVPVENISEKIERNQTTFLWNMAKGLNIDDGWYSEYLASTKENGFYLEQISNGGFNILPAEDLLQTKIDFVSGPRSVASHDFGPWLGLPEGVTCDNKIIKAEGQPENTVLVIGGVEELFGLCSEISWQGHLLVELKDINFGGLILSDDKKYGLLLLTGGFYDTQEVFLIKMPENEVL